MSKPGEREESIESTGTLQVGPSRRAWEDAFEIALMIGDCGSLIDHYDNREKRHIDAMRRQVMDRGIFTLDEYDIHYLIAIEVAHDLLSESVEKVEEFLIQLRNERLEVMGFIKSDVGAN